MQIFNTLTRKKEDFKSIIDGFVGMYVCGPTVYGDAHLGHARPAITFDILFRYLKHLGYKVRYIRNITDVGHLENDADEGEDKIAKKARLEQIEPMEVVQYFSDRYHENMEQLNVLKPSIEPRASGHILEQQEMISKILENGYAYEKNGSVYFDVEKYNQDFDYGKLSGRVLDDLKTNTRQLDGQDEKKNPFDFALWKKAAPEHIMRWNSQWSEGFPGWHLECSVMSTKYLGEKFDIHGGGLDLLFPHHECEIAQSKAANNYDSVKYWMHNNMITINGQKMGKSLGNFITLEEFFTGTHKLIEKEYSAMTVRFFILQAHYRSTLDFSNEALAASEKGLNKLLAGIKTLEKIIPQKSSSVTIDSIEEKCYAAMDDDINTPILISHLFDAVKLVNNIAAGNDSISETDLEKLSKLFKVFIYDILGISEEELGSDDKNDKFDAVINLLLNLRLEAKRNKDFEKCEVRP